MSRPRFLVPFFLGVVPLVLVGCTKPAPADPRTEAPLVRIATVQAPAASARSFSGTVAARVQSDLGFRVPGKVIGRLVDVGQSVRRGQVLMRIDPVDLKLAARGQEESVAAIRARAQQAIDDEARYRDLRGTGAISATAYDQAKAAADAARAQLRAAEAQAEVVRNATRYAELVADVDGVVMDVSAEVGQVVAAGQIVMRLAQAGRREAVVQLPETLRPAVGSTAQATIFGKEGTAGAARLRQLSDAADRTTRTFEARYVLDGELASAPLGSTVTLRIADGVSVGPDADGVQVPIAAIFDAGRGPGVWRVDGDPAKVAWKPVSVRRMDDDSARIGGELKPGDRIVALGAHLLRDGQAVRTGNLVPTPTSTPTPAGGARP
jgi:RND family efflux transporter MFP subunit